VDVKKRLGGYMDVLSPKWHLRVYRESETEEQLRLPALLPGPDDLLQFA
jgi:hypothetical protein